MSNGSLGKTSKINVGIRGLARTIIAVYHIADCNSHQDSFHDISSSSLSTFKTQLRIIYTTRHHSSSTNPSYYTFTL
ncbi:hypothetical protein QTP88_015168 [Uroleucon formosanum]